MYWYIWFGISVALFLVTVFDAMIVRLFRYRRKRILTPNRALILGTFTSASFLFCPIYLAKFSDPIKWVDIGKSVLLAMQHSVRLFAFEGDFLEFFSVESLVGMPPILQMYYTGFSAILYAFAPLLTFTLLLSFFKNFTAYRKYVMSFWKHTHVFSELNEKSLALAKSIDDTYNKVKKEGKKRYKLLPKELIVFTDVLEKDDEINIELIEEAREMGAILFSRDLESIKYCRKHSFRKVNFYLISDDEAEKIGHAESIIRDYGKCKSLSFRPKGKKAGNDGNNKLYVFSNNIESKCFLDAYPDKEKQELLLEVIRINDIRALIYYNLNQKGLRLFECAKDVGEETREISAVVIGMGQYGTEMIKALLWYCQMPGYRVKITAFDERENIKSVFEAACPEIELGKAIDKKGDMRYTLDLCQAKFGTEDFYKAIEDKKVGIHEGTYLFVCLGSDRENITATMGIRNRLAKHYIYPTIETVVYDSALKKRIDLDFVNQKIGVIGDLENFYSEGTVINSALIKNGLDVHQRWDRSKTAKNNYYMNDYNYYSSLAGALHRALRTQIVGYVSKIPQGMMKKEREDQARKVFPFYYGGSNDKSAENTKLLFQELLPKLNDNDSIETLSEDMNAFADCLYIKLAHLYYLKMKPDERREVLIELQKTLVKKILKELKKYLEENCRKKVPILVEDIVNGTKKILEDEFPELAKKEVLKDKTKEHPKIDLKAFFTSNGYYEKLREYLKKETEITERAAKRQVDKVRNFFKKEDFIWDIPMALDGKDYIDGYNIDELFFDENKNESALTDAQQREKNERSKKIAMMKQMFDSIVAVQTKNAKNAEEKRKIICSLEYSEKNLSDEEKMRVKDYVRKKRNISDTEMNMYFEKGKCFADIEHIRWNAYMRSEGFREAMETENRYKLHFDLVSVEMLTFKDCIKDI